MPAAHFLLVPELVCVTRHKSQLFSQKSWAARKRSGRGRSDRGARPGSDRRGLRALPHDRTASLKLLTKCRNRARSVFLLR